jgi:iron complex transport system substrate-binding protein
MSSCKSPENQEQKKWITISNRIHYQKFKDYFELKSGKYLYKIPKSKLPFKKVVLLNASLVGYFTSMQKENSIVGISSPEYIYSQNILQLIDQKKIISVGDEAKYDLEKIISLQPDAVFTNYIENFENTYSLLKKNGIEVIFIDEYLEEIPLEKSKIVELFGEFLGCKSKADSVYQTIEKDYYSLSNLAKKEKVKPVVIANEMYGNLWYMPGGNTVSAHLISDAGATYILEDNKDSKAVPMSFEEVFAQAQKAQFWVNIGIYTNKKSLLAINPIYSKLPVFDHGKLFAITAKQRDRANDYFESGVVRADLVLKDYIKIFHPNLLPNYQLTFLKELQ